MNIINFFSSPFFTALGKSLLHSLWQSCLLFVVMMIVLRIIKNAAANVKYKIAYSSLCLICAWFVFTFFKEWEMQQMHRSWMILDADNLNDTTFLAVKNPATDQYSFITQMLPFLMLAYLLGVLFIGLRFMNNYRHIIFLKTKGLMALNAAMQERMEKLSHQLNVKEKVKAFVSSYVDVPVMIGFIKPVILLPIAFVNNLSIEEIETILIHELAHIRRKDYLLNLLQSFIETVLFFNPFVWLISTIIRDEREKACDEMVIEFAQPTTYAKALLSLEKNIKPLIAQAASDKEYKLLNRIKNFTMRKNKLVTVRQKAISVLIVVLGVISIAWFSPDKKENISKNIIVKNRSLILSQTFEIDTPVAPAKPGTIHLQPIAMNVKTPVVNAMKNMPDIKVPEPPVPPVVIAPPMPEFNLIDSPPGIDSAKISRFFHSDAWKKYRNDLKVHTDKIWEFYKSDEWKNYQQKLRDQTAKMKDFYKSDEWKKTQEEMRKNAAKIRDYYNSDEWEKNRDEFLANSDNFRKQAEEFRKNANSQQWKSYQKQFNKQSEEYKKMAEKFKKHFNSDSWKKQTDAIRKNAERLSGNAQEYQKFFQSDEWKKQQQGIQNKMQELNKFFQSDEWKDQQKSIQDAAKKMQEGLEEPK